jgi:hypothetical protein
MSKYLKTVLAAFGLLLGMSSCVSIAEYQKVYLNDKDMLLADDELQTFESNFQTYREGASGANGGKSGGGCGCN